MIAVGTRRVGDLLRGAGSMIAAARSVTTRLGVWCAVGGLVALTFGLCLGWGEFTTIGTVLTVLVGWSAVFLIGRPDVEVVLRLAEPRTSMGQPVAASVSARGGRLGRWSRTQVEVPIGAAVRELRIRPGADGDEVLFVPADRRGVMRVGPVRTVRGDPIGLFRRDAVLTEVQELRVHTETIALPSNGAGFVRDLDGEATRDLTSDDLSFHALREYLPGDDRRHVHWKSTARTGRLTVRQFEVTRRSRVLVVFSLHEDDYASEEDFELTVSAAASIALRAMHDGRSVTLVTSPPVGRKGGTGRLRPVVVPSAGRTLLLDALSDVERGSTDVGLAELVAGAAPFARDVSSVYLVAGAAVGARVLRSSSTRFPAGANSVGIVCAPGRMPAVHRVGRFSIVTIGTLDDLRRSFAQQVDR